MAQVAFEDLSGTSTPVTSNPYDGILQACNNDSQLIQSRYHTHRTTRNQQQKEKILSPEFSGWILDPILTKLAGPQADPNFTDPRNCLVFWARPTSPIKTLIQSIQQRLQDVAPSIWLMPISNLHMTAMEVTHSLTAPEINDLVTRLLPSSKIIADLPSTPNHAARLIKPMLSFDAAALALSFVPAAGEAISTNINSSQRTPSDDNFTYHHLRRSLHDLISNTIPVASRYVVPSAHLTIARFNTPNPFADPNTISDENNPLDRVAGIQQLKREALMREIDKINQWLQDEYWPRPVSVTETTNTDGQDATRQTIREGGEWIVGQEKGLDFRKGTLWYGDGETVYLGKGIAM